MHSRSAIFRPRASDQPLGPRPPISGGFRFDYVESDFQSGTNRLDRTDDMMSWRAGLVYKPRPNGSIYFGYGTSFTPSIAAGNVGLSLTADDIDLEPEESRSFELGTKGDFFNARLSVGAALFRTEKTNARTAGVCANGPSSKSIHTRLGHWPAAAKGSVPANFTANLVANFSANFSERPSLETNSRQSSR